MYVFVFVYNSIMNANKNTENFTNSYCYIRILIQIFVVFVFVYISTMNIDWKYSYLKYSYPKNAIHPCLIDKIRMNVKYSLICHSLNHKFTRQINLITDMYLEKGLGLPCVL